ncbi:hypothetical protein FG379_001510 [Cryptosporidium bovis]|uniref:uncharacterized protein n=1 Tax=Cryptosporidium bovis TaxID=310047 RepID=UPI003519DC23|nr:hypothetical protein FG379_001510 [Cryptosporidium bovis]
MENVRTNFANSEDFPANVENFMKLSYKQQIELVTEQEKQKLKLYTDYIINSIPHNIRKLKIKDILSDEGKNILLTEEERNEILDKLNDIIEVASSNDKNKKHEPLTKENMTSLEIINEDQEHEEEHKRANLRRTKVKLLPIMNTCYTIIRKDDENRDLDNKSSSELNSSNVIDVISSVK